jgi:hypothetical protein
MHKNIVAAVLGIVLLIGAVGVGLADEALTPRDVPAKTIPVPSSVSTQIQATHSGTIATGLERAAGKPRPMASNSRGGRRGDDTYASRNAGKAARQRQGNHDSVRACIPRYA